MSSREHHVLCLDAVGHRVDEHDLFTSLSATVASGSCLGVVGDNGAGKSTLARIVCGLTAPTAGHVAVTTPTGRVVADDTDVRFRRLVSCHLGEDAVFAELTLAEHLRLLCATRGVRADRGDEALRDAGIADLADRYPHTLSTGQRQRFELCAAFAPDAPVVVLDEPEAGLDSAGRRWLSRSVERATAASSVVVLVSHDRDLVDERADRILTLGRRGQKS